MLEGIAMIKIISVADYARIKNISPQAVYKQINNNKLTIVFKEENNKKVKYIQADLTEAELNSLLNQVEQVESAEFGGTATIEEPNSTQQDFKPTEENKEKVKQPIEKPNSTIAENSRETELLNQIKELKQQLNEKEEIIKQKDNIIIDYASRFAEMAQQAQEIANKALTTTGQAQYLQAAEKIEPNNVKKKTFWHKLLNWYEDY